MYLKEIEISGFKSFADKININLDNEITCIVGPNGSGKSNILDAIRFVLGEQSVKSLRGDNLMSDIIFAGSKNRNPMHAASVNLTFDNSDNYLKIPYQDVSVKRRLYKTGENEYFLNGEKCRLKDIVDMFLDSAIGRDSFNIISQGDISRILSNSPSERRIVIEEAAGILKYKKRREEAFKKLDKTNLNLDRANDIIKEVEERRAPLKEQSERALEYLDYKEKLEKIEVALLVSEINESNLKCDEIKENIKKLEEENITLNKIISDPVIDNLKLQEIELDKSLDKLNRDLINLTHEKEDLNSKRLVLKERIKYSSNDIKILENINYIKESILELDKEINLLEKDIEYTSLTKDKIIQEIGNINQELNDKNTNKNKLNEEYRITDKEIFNINNKIEILKNNLEDNVYLNSNVRKILDNPRLTGICDALFNILKTSSKFDKCLSVCISTSKNFIVVDTPKSAKLAIDFLKDNNLGRATFLPLSEIKGKYIQQDILNKIKNEKGYLGVLSDHLEYDSKYQDIVLNQFGNIIVCECLDDANNLNKILGNKYRIITLDGDLIHVSGSITGGSLGNIKSLSNIKLELNDLELKCNIKNSNIKNLSLEISKLEKDINNLLENISIKKSNLLEINDNLNILENKLEDKKHKKSDLNLELKTLSLDDYSKDLDELNNKYYEKSLECEVLIKDISRLQKEKELIKSDILEKEGVYKINHQQLQKNEKEISSYLLLITKLSSKLDNNLNILNQEYSLTYEKASSDYFLEIPEIEAKNLVLEYKRKLKDIGMVNILAIDEYKEVNSRYEFLTNERNDLLHAKELLYSIIEEMDDVMKEEFIKTFKTLQIEFKKVFKEMFKGGDASLELTNPNDLLETGVEITACPPGKRLKTITLLSGGEKTLTAISLLFAILNIRPVPFCIFDEVEAALDEANVSAFGKYLSNYQDKTQFLLITHKKKTMEYAKTLYGITMQESGVSKLVSVKLENN